MIRVDAETARMIVERDLCLKIYEPFTGIVMIGAHGGYIGAAIFNNYDGRDVHFTHVSSGLLKMHDVRYIARYIFVTLGCHRCTAITKGTNERAIKALVQLGFKYEGTLREHFEDASGGVFGLLRSEQKLVRL